MVKRLSRIPKLLEGLISQAAAARIRGVSRSAIGYLVKTGKLQTQEVLGRLFVFETEVRAYKRGIPGPKPSTVKKRKKVVKKK